MYKEEDKPPSLDSLGKYKTGNLPLTSTNQKGQREDTRGEREAQEDRETCRKRGRERERETQRDRERERERQTEREGEKTKRERERERGR